MTDLEQFNRLGWLAFGRDAELVKWIEAVKPAALATAVDPAFSQWHRCEGTWFVGVNALANDGRGRVGSGPELIGEAMTFAREALAFGDNDLDRAQVSIMYPGYPKPRKGESAAAFKYRRDRDAAHVDGLHPSGENYARHQNEFQGFLLGIPLNESSEDAAPLVVWEGSHRIIGTLYRDAFEGCDARDWPNVDLTVAYQEARRKVFATCKRRIVHVPVGGAYIVHRFALHGVAPFAHGVRAGVEGRAILYFRPEIDRGVWLAAD